jgi:hypothetical protein
MPSGCLDTKDFSFAPPELILDLSENDARDVKVALDDEGRAFVLLENQIGATVEMHFATYSSSGWSDAHELATSIQGGTSWYPLVRSSPSGEVIASYRSALAGSTSLVAFASDTRGTLGLAGVGDDGNSSLIAGGVDIADEGATLLSYPGVEGGKPAVFGSFDYAEPEPLLEGVSGAYATSASLSPEGEGFIFGGSYEGQVQRAYAIPVSAETGFLAPEPIPNESLSPTNGHYGVSLGEGAALTAFGSRTSTSSIVQLFASYRTSAGTWSDPARFDAGDGSSHAKLVSLVQGAPGQAFVLWQEPDGYHAGLFRDSASVESAVALGTDFRYWSMAADRCGRAAIVYGTGGTTDIHVRHFIPGGGWSASLPLESGSTKSAVETDLAFSPSGEAMLVFVRSNHFYYSLFSDH